MGEDFDNRLVDHFKEEIKRKYKKDITGNNRAIRRLRTACEKAKRVLSSSTQTTVEVDSLIDGVDFSSNLTRARFEELCIDLFRSAMKPVEDVLRDGKMDKGGISEIILVGGSTRIPKIQQLLSEYFGGKELNKSVNPDEAVAYGAAVQAAILTGVKSKETDSIVLLDVTPLSLGVETAGEIMTVMIPRNRTIPVKKEQVFSTFQDNQPAATIKVYEGERGFTRDCNFLGSFTVEGITPARRGVPQIKIIYDINENGILTVTAFEENNNKCEKKNITIKRSTLSKEDIEKKLEEAEKFKEEDENNRKLVEARNQFEQVLYSAKSGPEDKNKEEIESLITEYKDWYENNKSASAEELTSKSSEFLERFNKLKPQAAPDGMPAGMSGMTPEMFAKMAENIPGGMPAGMTPEMCAQMASQMTPEMCAQMAAQMGASGGEQPKSTPTVDEVD
jgi:heat shock protein 1/8